MHGFGFQPTWRPGRHLHRISAFGRDLTSKERVGLITPVIDRFPQLSGPPRRSPARSFHKLTTSSHIPCTCFSTAGGLPSGFGRLTACPGAS